MTRKLSFEELKNLGLTDDQAKKVVEKQSLVNRELTYTFKATPEKLAELEATFPEVKFTRKTSYKSKAKVEEAQTDAAAAKKGKGK